jgi:thiamine biosynthesis lipoprotein
MDSKHVDSKRAVSRPGAGYSIRNAGSHWSIAYSAMASPCEVLVRRAGASEPESASHIEKLASIAYEETIRIERKFSRYRRDNIVHAINRSNGAGVAVDEETSRLLQYAGQCYQLSGGRFDITSGVLRSAWTFNGLELTPDRKLIESLLERVGWSRVEFDRSSIRLPRGMEIDFGGIGKEYAADRVAGLVAEAAGGSVLVSEEAGASMSDSDAAGASVLVNLGGDIRALACENDRRPWTIGIEKPVSSEGTVSRDEKPAVGDAADGEKRPGGGRAAVGQVEIADGGVATSGDSRRFCIVDGVRLGHILDPRTGWPVAGAPRSVSVIADTCTAAGFLATLAILHGSDAESFLHAQEVTHHCIR